MYEEDKKERIGDALQEAGFEVKVRDQELVNAKCTIYEL